MVSAPDGPLGFPTMACARTLGRGGNGGTPRVGRKWRAEGGLGDTIEPGLERAEGALGIDYADFAHVGAGLVVNPGGGVEAAGGAASGGGRGGHVGTKHDLIGHWRLAPRPHELDARRRRQNAPEHERAVSFERRRAAVLLVARHAGERPIPCDQLQRQTSERENLQALASHLGDKELFVASLTRDANCVRKREWANGGKVSGGGVNEKAELL